MYRTKAGLILEKLLSSNQARWLWCWTGNDSSPFAEAYDCACCMTWQDDSLLSNCGCHCHARIEEMASLPNIRMWLLAAEGAGELPRFFTSYHDKLKYCREVASKHGECTCSFCDFANNDLKIRKFPLNGEDNSNVSEYQCSMCNCVFQPDKEMIQMICRECELAKER
jgi:hypothetical protein